MTTTNLSAPDITCGGCANAIRRALGGVSGVENVTVDVAAKTVTVQHVEGTASRETILDTLDRAGFPSQEVAPTADTGSSETSSCSCCHA